MTNENNFPPRPLKEGEHYYINDDGLMVFTSDYHLLRGECCENGCLHCPYGFKKVSTNLR